MTYGMSSPLGGGSGVSGSGLAGNKIPKGYRQGQLQQYTPAQMQLFQQGLGSVSPESYTGRLAGGDESIFNEIEAPAHREFQGQLGNLASRFSGMGTGGRRGSGFQNLATAASSNFAQDLASRRSELQRNAIQDLHNMSQQLLSNRPYEQFLTEKQQKEGLDWGGIGGGLAGGVGGFFAGGPAGALAGAGLGYNAFSRNGQGNSMEDYGNFSNAYLQ